MALEIDVRPSNATALRRCLMIVAAARASCGVTRPRLNHGAGEARRSGAPGWSPGGLRRLVDRVPVHAMLAAQLIGPAVPWSRRQFFTTV